MNSTWYIQFNAGPISRAVWGVGLGRLVAVTVGSNPALGIDVCLCVSVLCYAVYIDARRQADDMSKGVLPRV
jgi:hypothetical protein